jgi:hypothetical protein
MDPRLLEALNAIRRSELHYAARLLSALPDELSQTDTASMLLRRLDLITAQTLARGGLQTLGLIDLLVLRPGETVPAGLSSALAEMLVSANRPKLDEQESADLFLMIQALAEEKRLEGVLLDALVDLVSLQGDDAAVILRAIFSKWRAVGYDEMPLPQLDRLIEAGKKFSGRFNDPQPSAAAG